MSETHQTCVVSSNPLQESSAPTSQEPIPKEPRKAAASLADKVWDLGNLIAASATASLLGFLATLGSSESLRTYLYNVHVVGSSFEVKGAVCAGLLGFVVFYCWGIFQCSRREEDLRRQAKQIAPADKTCPVLAATHWAKTVRLGAVCGLAIATVLAVVSVGPHKYCFKVLKPEGGSSTKWVQEGTPCGEKSRDLSPKELPSLLKELTNDGWEIAYVQGTGDEFKRILLKK